MRRFWAIAAALLAVMPTVAAPVPVRTRGPYPATVTLGKIQDPAITESSGLAASHRRANLYWTHNDSGDGPLVYALGPHGEERGTFRLRGVSKVTDCEDMAMGPGPKPGAPYLYLGDIGDNNSARKGCVVWRVPEPAVTQAAAHSSQTHPVLTERADALRFQYPDGPHDAETLLVHPKTDRIFVIAKNKSGIDGIYEFPMPLDTQRRVTLRKVFTIHISGEPPFYPNLVTGGDIAPDGRRVVIRTYWLAYEFTLPAGSSDFDAVWRSRPVQIQTPLQAQGEGICYTYPSGDALVLSSEGKHATLYELRR